MPGEGGAKGGTTRKTGNMGSMSGADDAIYYEYKKSNNANKHPLFKKFRYQFVENYIVLFYIKPFFAIECYFTFIYGADGPEFGISYCQPPAEIGALQ